MKNILREEAMNVNSLLTKYIDIHDSILNQSGTFWSVIKNLFNPIDYESLYKKTVNLAAQFEQKKEELNELEEKIHDSVSSELQKYFQQLLTFFGRLYNTVQLLRERQQKLFLKSKGQNFSRNEFMALQNKYQQSIKMYKKEGEKLNELNPIVFF